MFDMFDLFTSLHPHILIPLGACALACILVSSYSYILTFMCTCLNPRILSSSIFRFTCTHLCPRILISSSSCVLACNLYPHILSSLGLCWYMLVGILGSSHPHIYALMYFECLLVSLYPHILISTCSSVRTCLGNWNQIKQWF